MPFESGAARRRKIAVIGAGITGLGAAYALSDHHDITLYEAEARLGGHARTVTAGRNNDQPVDTGFIVFNHANYPNLTRIFETLSVPIARSEMSFGASVRGGQLEYGLAGAGAFFAQRRNALNPRFWAMLRDIFRFNRDALEESRKGDLTIGEFIETMRLGRYFRDYYLLPFSGAIWSTPTQEILQFPARAMVQFFKNHGLLGYSDQHQWYTVQGGSCAYVSRLEAVLRRNGVTLRPSCPVEAVRRPDTGGVDIKTYAANWEHYDEVIFATHSDDALRLLSDATETERANLGPIAYQPNEVVLHADPRVMPRSRKVWSSWNYAEAPVKTDARIDVTYWMNALQPIPKDDPLFVTLNSTRPIREELIFDQVTMRHPVFDLAALRAQERVHAANGQNNTWVCGAWLRHGFHEDGLTTALGVADQILAQDVLPMAAE